MEKFEGNELLPQSVFHFPRFEEELALKPPLSPTLDNLGQGFVSAGLGVFLRSGLADPTTRKDIESKLGRQVDWPALSERDAKIGGRLKGIVERHFGKVP